MSVREMSRAIGQFGHVQVGEFTVLVQVLDVRRQWGRTDCLVKAVNAEGEAWVSVGRVQFAPEVVDL